MQSRRPKIRSLMPRLEERTPLAGGALSHVERARLTAPFAGLEAGAEVLIKTQLEGATKAETTALIDEGRLGLGLRHPNIVRTLAILPDFEGRPALIMEWIPGETLDELFAKGPVPEPLVRRIGADIARALEAMHTAGFAHNDVKPSNLRLAASGAAVLLDLGLATTLDGVPPPHNPGSLEWMAPERQNGAPPSAAADVFALGLVLFQAATGTKAPKPLAPPSTLAPRLSPFLDEWVALILAPDPSARPRAGRLAELATEGESSKWWAEKQAHQPATTAARGAGDRWPLVGRDEQLAFLDQLATRAFAPEATERPGALLLQGPEGIGKWELITAFAAGSRRRDPAPIVLAIRATDIREARPLGTLLELLRTWLGVPHGQSPRADHRATLERLLPPKGAETLLSVLDASSQKVVPGSVSTALVDWLAALASEVPLLLFLDELQKAGPDTRRALVRLMQATGKPELRLLLIAGERNDLPVVPEIGLARHADETLTLGPIDEPALADFVRHVFQIDTPQLRLTRVLMQRSRGNPGLLFELLRGLEASGAVRSGPDGKLELAIAPESLPLPGSLRKSIETRFRSLDRAARTLLARLAVLRGSLTPEIIQRAFPDLRQVDLTSRLGELVRLGWLVSYGDHFRFARPAQSEVIRSTLTTRTLERLHVEAAAALAPRPGERATITMGVRRAWHLREAHRPRAVVEAVRPVIRTLVARAQPQRIATLADWGLEALDELNQDPETGEPGDRDLTLVLLEMAADAAGRLGERERERQLLDRLADLGIDPENDPTRTARIYLLHGRYARATAAFGLARGLFNNALEFARKAGRLQLESEAETQLARVQAEIGELGHARELCASALEHAGTDLTLRATAMIASAQVEILSARPDLALKFIDQALAAGRHGTTGLPGALKSEAHLARARIWRDLGRPQRALGSAEKALELATFAQERVLEAEAAARLGGLLVVAGREQAAEAQLREALLISEEVEDRRGASLARLWLGTLIAERTDGKGAAELERSAAEAGRIGLFRTQAMGLAIAARVYLIRTRQRAGSGQHDLAAAKKLSLTATELIERHGAEQRDRIVIHGTRAMLLHQTGRDEEARSQVRELRRNMRRANQRIADAVLRRLHRRATTRLLEAVLSSEGPIFPRG